MTPTHKIPPFLPSFATRRGRGIGEYRQKLLEELLPQLRVTPETNFIELGKSFSGISFEIGFGNGEHIFTRAHEKPNELFIGCEPYTTGVATLLSKLDKNPAPNLRFFTGDARILLSAIPDKYLQRLYVLFPDPWPKIRQKKRRIINQESLTLFSQKLAQEGLLIIETDHEEYATWIEEHLNLSPFLRFVKDEEDLRIDTKYKRKAAKKGQGSRRFVVRTA
jgi:tRNA (guanine-N(7)-)-methyltransferase